MILPALFSLPLASLASGDVPEWGGFRGTDGTGQLARASLPASLDPEGTLQWRVEVPSGYSSPVVAGKNLFLTGATKSKLVVLCLDPASGEQRWSKEFDFDGRRPGQNSPAAPTPVTDGEIVVALFHHLGLIAFDTTGKELWRVQLGPINIPHGMSTSPLLYGDLVVLQVDQDRAAYLVAFDKKTGKERWRTERAGAKHSYATPAIWAPNGGPAEVIVSGSFQTTGYSLDKGEKLWWVEGNGWQSKCAPVVAGKRCFVNAYSGSISEMGYPTLALSFEEALVQHDGDGNEKIGKSEYGDPQLHQLWFLFDLDEDGLLDQEEWEFGQAANDKKGGFFALDLGQRGAQAPGKLAWTLEGTRGVPGFTTPLVVGNTRCMIDDGGLLTSLDVSTGKIVRQERVGQPDEFFASPVAGDGKVYLVGKKGVLSVVTAESEWKELASHALESEEEFWATPSLSARAVFVRGTEALYCFEKQE
ncbi:MAG: PQQ-binding-like beta-propeller repeat protein [Planctomycetota bacterium]